MKIKRNGVILTSNNEFVISQWKKSGYEEIVDFPMNPPEPQDEDIPEEKPVRKRRTKKNV